MVIQYDELGSQCILVCMEAQQKGQATLQSFTGLLSKGYNFGLLFLKMTDGYEPQCRCCAKVFQRLCWYIPVANLSRKYTNIKILTFSQYLKWRKQAAFTMPGYYYEAETITHRKGLKSKHRSLNIWKQKLTAQLCSHLLSLLSKK